MKLTRKRVLEVFRILQSFKGKVDKTFGMYILVNEKKLVPLIQEIDEIRKISFASEEIALLQQQEKDILFKYVARDENNNPIQMGENNFKIQVGKEREYKKEVDDFFEINKFTLEDYQTQVKHVNELLDEEVEVEIMKIPYEVVPKTLDLRQELAILVDILKEDLEEIVLMMERDEVQEPA